MRKFSGTLCGSVDYAENTLDYAENFRESARRLILNKKKLYWYLGFSSYFHLYLVCYEIVLINYVMCNDNNTTVILLAEVDFLLMHKQYNSRCYVIYYNTAR